MAWTPSPVVRGSLWLHASALAAAPLLPAYWMELAGLLVGNHALLIGGMHPRCAMLGPNMTRLPPACAAAGKVALTFDDGPHADVTPRVLDLLDAKGAKASFFVVGAAARRHPGLVRDIVRRGHSVENHTDTHPLGFACLPPSGMLRQLRGAQAAILDACGIAPAFFRAPAGMRNPLLDPVLARVGLSLVSWTRRGYDTATRRPATVLRRLSRGLAAGDVLLLHDANSARSGGGSPVVLEVLPPLLAQLAERGLSAVALPRPALPAGAAPVSAAAAACRPSAAGASR